MTTGKRQATLEALGKGTSPLPQPGAVKPLIDSQALTAAFTGATSEVVSVLQARKVGLWIKFGGNNDDSADNQARILVALSGALNEPAVGDDSWYFPAVLDASPTDADLSSLTPPTGADYTLNTHRSYEAGPLALITNAVGADDEHRLLVGLDVTLARWMYVAAAEVGDTDEGDLGTIQVDWNMAL